MGKGVDVGVEGEGLGVFGSVFRVFLRKIVYEMVYFERTCVKGGAGVGVGNIRVF